MAKYKPSKPIKLNIHLKPVFQMEDDETEDGSACALDLPLFITTSEQREEINEAMIKSEAIET